MQKYFQQIVLIEETIALSPGVYMRMENKYYSQTIVH